MQIKNKSSKQKNYKLSTPDRNPCLPAGREPVSKVKESSVPRPNEFIRTGTPSDRPAHLLLPPCRVSTTKKFQADVSLKWVARWVGLRVNPGSFRVINRNRTGGKEGSFFYLLNSADNREKINMTDLIDKTS